MNSPERFHALDAVRGFALLSGIVLHASMSFVPGLLVPGGHHTKEASPSVTLGVLFFVIHVFRMTTFFLIAGFFAHQMLERKGPAGLLRDRGRRVLLPLVVGRVAMALLVVAFLWGGAWASGGLPPAAPPAGGQGFPLFHLWFLYYLLLMYAVALAAREALAAVCDRRRLLSRADAGVRRLFGAGALPFVLAVPLAACLLATRGWSSWGTLWQGIPTPDRGLTPRLSALAGYGTAFVVGWLLHRQMSLLRVCERRWPLQLAVAAAAIVICLGMTGLTPEFRSGLTQPFPARLAYAVCYSVGVWSSTFAVIGLALRFASGHSVVRRYVADSSYWLYLTHLPVVTFLQMVMGPLGWHWTLKFPLMVAVTFGGLLLSYQYFVRFTVIGAVLSGRRRLRPAVESSQALPNEARPTCS